MVTQEFVVRHCVTVEPEGNRGVMRVVNSRKLTAIADRVLGKTRTKRLKEIAGFGQTILLVAQAKAP